MGCGGSAPDYPDQTAAAIAGQRADLLTLETRRRIEAAAALGIPVEYVLNGRRRSEDFTGLGDVEVNQQYAEQLLPQLLALQRELGPEFVKLRLDELQRSDPEGFQMRRDLWDRIRTGVEGARTADRPGAEALQASILDELERGGALPPSVAQRVSQDVLGQQVARGNWLGNAPAQQEAGAVADASENYRQMRQQQALQFLTSGVSPTDVAAREEQQGLNNLGSFLTGETPQAQFAQVSGAGTGAAPWDTGGVRLPGVDPNAAARGLSFASGLYTAQSNLANQQVNPWVAGLTGGVQGLNIWAAAQESSRPQHVV